MGMVDDVESATQRSGQRLRSVKRIRRSERAKKPQIGILLNAGNLLHIGPFVLTGLIAQQIPNSHAI